MNGLQLQYDITHGALWIQNPIYLPYRPPWPLISDQKRAKTVEKEVCDIFISVTSYSTYNIISWANEWSPDIL
jgi:hypothetical protein